MLNVEPATFSCPTHGHDLTPQVVEALDELGPPVAYRRGNRPFEVLVFCPGGEAPDGTHELACEGRYSR